MEKSELLDWKMYVSPEESEAVQLKAFECEIYWSVPENTPQVQWTNKDSLGIGDYGELCLNPVNNRRATTPQKWIALADKYLAQKNADVNDTDVVDTNNITPDWNDAPDEAEAWIYPTQDNSVKPGWFFDNGENWQRVNGFDLWPKHSGPMVVIERPKEAVKADEPDWDNAPEGAEFFYRGRWLKKVADGFLEFLEDDASGQAGWIFFTRDLAYQDNLIEKPEPTQSPSDEWDGEGLPPVGIECEYRRDSGEVWFKCRVLFSGEGLVVFSNGENQLTNHPALGYTIKFRPISKEQKHREEVIEHAMSYLGDGCTSKEVLSAAQQWAELGMLKCPIRSKHDRYCN